MYVADLESQLNDGPPWINTTEYSTPVYTVGPNEPTSRVVLDTYDDQLQAVWDQVPILPDARPAAGTDHQIVMQLYGHDVGVLACREARRRLARALGRLYAGRLNKPRLLLDPRLGGNRIEPPLARWSGASERAQGGPHRPCARPGHPTHARQCLLMASATHRRDIHQPGRDPGGGAFWIDPSLDLARIPMSPIVRMLAVAAQRYGIVVRDTAADVTFYAQDPTPTGTNPSPVPAASSMGAIRHSS